MDSEKTATENEGKTGPETPKRPRRRFTPEAPDPTPPPAAETSDSDAQWQDKDRGGYFAGRPGPGRGHTADASSPRGTGAKGEGEGDLDLLQELIRAIERRGPKWFDGLIKDSPVVAAQLLSALRKTQPAPGTPGGSGVTVNFGEGTLAGIASAIMQPRTPDDLDTLDAEQLRTEIQRQRGEIERLQRAANDLPPAKPEESYEPILPEQQQPSTECLSCLRHGHAGRMIPHLGKCDKCGQMASDNEAGVLTVNTLAHKKSLEEPINAAAFSVGPDDGGWRPITGTSIAAIREGLGSRGPDRGMF